MFITSYIDTHTVCSVCLDELPEELKSLSAVVCQGVEHSFKKGFRWLTPLNTIIRPTPFNVFKMFERGQRYRNNHSYQSCDWSSKDECVFPHSSIEERWWNQWQEKCIDEIALTNVGKQFYIRSRDGALHAFYVECDRVKCNTNCCCTLEVNDIPVSE